MSTIILNCGCVISRSMFSARNVISISLCAEHQETFANEMWAIVKMLPGVDRTYVQMEME